MDLDYPLTLPNDLSFSLALTLFLLLPEYRRREVKRRGDDEGGWMEEGEKMRR